MCFLSLCLILANGNVALEQQVKREGDDLWLSAEGCYQGMAGVRHPCFPAFYSK